MQNGIRITHPSEEATALEQALAALEECSADPVLADVPVDAVLAWLAAGRFERVRRLLLHAEPAPQLPLAAARYVAWTGDLRTAAAIWQPVRSATEELLRSRDADAADAGAARLRAMTCVELQRTATDVGDAALAAALHRAARADTTDADAHAHGGSTAAAVVLRFVHHTLGVEPDATRHRLRLRPRMLAGMRLLTAEHIRFGDGGIAFAATCSADAGSTLTRLTVRVRQDSGAVPLTVLLEPVVEGAVSATYVDDRAAALTPRPHEGCTLVPVQLVLDQERSLALDMVGC